MRSEDRPQSKRVFPLLQNTDLENLAFATLQSTGQPIRIEDMNEQEMIDLIIVNLARLCVKGEWDGLLTAGSGGGGSASYIGDIMASGYDIFCADQCPVYGGYSISASTLGTNQVMCYPFVSPKTGNVDTLSVRVNASATNTMRVGIYSDHATHYPTSQIGGDTDIDCSSTGVKSASPASSVALVQGTTYWLCYVWTSNYGAASPILWYNSASTVGWQKQIDQSPKGSLIDATGPANDLPATMPSSGYETAVNKKLMCGITYA